MRIAPANIALQYAAAGTTLAYCLKVVRRDGAVFGFGNTDRRITVAGVDYEPGFEPSDMVSTAGAAVDNFEVTVFPDDATLTETDLIAGLWDYAAFTMFEVDFTDPDAGSTIHKRGKTGEAQVLRGHWTIEFHAMRRAWQQSVGAVTSKTCRYRLGSTAMPQGLCKVDLTPWTHTYAVTGAASRRVFTCTAAAEATDYYGEGTATGLTGANANHSRKIKSFSGGVFTLTQEMPFAVGVGDTFTFVAGCRKRLSEDCKLKFDNVLNFGGEPHVPGVDLLTADPVISG